MKRVATTYCDGLRLFDGLLGCGVLVNTAYPDPFWCQRLLNFKQIVIVLHTNAGVWYKQQLSNTMQMLADPTDIGG